MSNRILSIENNDIAKAILGGIGDGVISTDIEGKINYINAAAEDITGWKAQDMQGLAFDNIMPIFDAITGKPNESIIRRVSYSNTSVGLTNNSAFKKKDGQVIYLSANCSPINDEDGAIKGAVVVFRDITRIKRLELEYINEKNNFEVIFRDAPIGMVLINEEQMITRANNHALSWIGKSIGQVVNKRFGDAFSCKWKIHSGLECGSTPNCSSCEMFHSFKLGLIEGRATSDKEINKAFLVNDIETKKWLKISVSPIVVAGEINLVMTLNDITDMKQIELELKTAKESLLEALEFAHLGFWEYNEMSGECSWSDEMFHMFGYKEQEFIPTYDEFIKIIHPEDKKIISSIKDHKYDTEREFDIRIIRQDKELSWIYHKVKFEFSTAGELLRTYGVVGDITQRKLDEAKLRESEEKFRELAENIGEVIWVRQNEHMVYISPAYEKVWGRSSQDIKDNFLGVIDTIHPDDKERVLKAFISQNDSIGQFEDQFRIIRPDGAIRWIWIREFPIHNENGKIIRYVGIGDDITKIKENEESLQRAKEAAEIANKAKSEFLANMSHEIRTPINGTLGMIELTLLTDLQEEQRDNLNSAMACANSLLSIINDILDFSKIEAGKLILENINFDIVALVKELTKSHALRANQKGMDLSYLFSPNVPRYLIGDPNRLHQILNNLIGNAVKFTESGYVKISITNKSDKQEEAELEFSIKDSGIGISDEDTNKLFHKFSQIDSSLTKGYGGTGLGLAISRQLVELMGGAIWVSSEKGVGSTFGFSIKFENGKKELQSPKEEKTQQMPVKKIDILVVENDEISRKVICQMIKQKGFMVDMVANGEEAVSLLENKRFDLVFMDIQMPVMDGITATKIIRENEGANTHTTIIATTANALQGDKEKYLSQGFDAYLSKPIRMEEIHRMLDWFTPNENFRSNRYLHNVNFDEDNRLITNNEDPCPYPPENNEFKHYIEAIGICTKGCNFREIENIAAKIKKKAQGPDNDKFRVIALKIQFAARRGDVNEVINCMKIIEKDL